MILFCVKVLIVNYANYREIVQQFYIYNNYTYIIYYQLYLCYFLLLS